MPDQSAEREELLRREYHNQTARIAWHELQTHHARGRVVVVSPDLDLVEVAVQLGMDNTVRFQDWIEAADVAPVSDEQARRWYQADASLWAVVSPPWVLVQRCES
jgi:hypothetical protein